ncbi:MAG TPA: ABC transporter permease [Verrucomicrobiae bacterium]|jgi:peptide/nickel transport system permease protein/oligopeptide transport system permease protein|nr:ABC transporter permease [Verrucomicrobiae bacterium]
MSDERVESSKVNVESDNASGAAPLSISNSPEHASPARRAWQRFRKNRPALFSGGYVIALLVVIIAWPVALRVAAIARPGGATWAKAYAPEQLSDAQFQPPGSQHWFGTDEHGRDVLSRVLYGAQISLLVGFVGAAVSLVIGVLWGAIAGLAGGRVDSMMMRIVDVLYSLPSIIFVIVLLTTLGEKLKQMPLVRNSPALEKEMRLLILFVGLGAISWLTMARIVRGQVLSLRTRPFVDASRALGATPWRILMRHIIPNVFSVVIVYVTLTVPAIVLYESFLSYLGLGVQPPMASWGSLISEGVDQINPIRIYWWMIVFPGGVLVSTLLALNFLGDGLRDAWDVKG